MSRLAFSPWSRLAAAIATAPMAQVRQVASMVAAAVLTKRIRALILKADRERAHDTLGPDGFAMATHEAPVLHPALHELDAASATDPLFGNDSDATSRRNRITGFGYHVVGRFFDAFRTISRPTVLAAFAANCQIRRARPVCKTS